MAGGAPETDDVGGGGQGGSCPSKLAERMDVFYERDADLALIRGRRVAVVGYGSQGRTHALNLRDSGVGEIRVALKPGLGERRPGAAPTASR